VHDKGNVVDANRAGGIVGDHQHSHLGTPGMSAAVDRRAWLRAACAVAHAG